MDNKVKIITNGIVVTGQGKWNFIHDGAVAFDESKILSAGKKEIIEQQYQNAEIYDAKGGYIMPAFINPHEHSYSAGVRGLSMKKFQPKQFMENLTQKWWNLDRWLTPEQIKLGALAFYIDAAKCGVTTEFEHYASYGVIENCLDLIGEAAQKVGIRICAGFEVSDRWGKDTSERAIKENLRWIDFCKSQNNDFLKGTMALHASFTLSDDTLNYLNKYYDGKQGCHIHIAECVEDEEDSYKKYSMNISERLDKFGLLNDNTLIAHGVHLSDDEINLINEHKACVVNNLESNMNNAVGCPPTEKLIKKGIVTGFGMDGFSHDVFLSWRIANAFYKFARKDINAAWEEIPTMLFINNPIIAERFFGKKMGALEPGAVSDIIVINYDAPTPICAENFNSHMLFGMNASNVKMTFCGGKLISKDGVCLTVDEEKVLFEARKEMEKLWGMF